MDAEKLKDSVKTIVQETLEEHAAAGLESKIEEALKVAENAVSDLTEQLSEAQKKALEDAATIEKLEAEAEGFKAEASSKAEEVEALKTKHEALLEEAASVKDELEGIKMDMLVKGRMDELAELKIARAGESYDKQVAAVRVLTDEEFALYKDEMVSLRDEFLAAAAEAKAEEDAKAETEAEAAEAAKEDKPEEDVSSDEVGSEDASEDDDAIKTPPADVDGAREDASILPPSGDDVDKNKRFKDFSVGLSMLLQEGRNRNEDK